MSNKFSQYRAIKHDRAFKTLGKITWWRIVAGAALLIVVLFMAGAVSQYFAVRGNFIAAEKCMLFPGWMETYKPEAKAFFEAGARMQEGDTEAAYERLADVEELEAALNLRSDAAIELADEALAAGDNDAAYGYIASVAPESVAESSREAYRDICGRLLEIFSDDTEKSAELESVISYQPEAED